MLLAVWSSVSVDGGAGYCPPCAINRTLIHFARHWPTETFCRLLWELADISHKSPGTGDTELPEHMKIISLLHCFSCHTSMMKSFKTKVMVLNTKAITPITIRKHWIWFQEEKHYLCGLILRSRGRKSVRYPWDITTGIIDTSEEWETHNAIVTSPSALSVSMTLCRPAWRPLMMRLHLRRALHCTILP